MASGANGGSSFESPHNTIHIFVGGRGHMSPVTYSGFDPCLCVSSTFCLHITLTINSFLHHANVDRQFAMWQAIYPDSWMVPEISTSGTWTIFPNTLVDDKTPLTPFTTGDKKTPWTSASARYTKSFGYSYPDVQDWLPRTAAELSANVTARVNQLYNPNGVLTRRSSSMRIRGSSLMERATEKVWSVNVAVPNAALGEAFYIDVVVGDVTLGKLVILSAPSKVELDAGAKRVSYGEYPLTAGLAGVAEDDVVEYLKANLKFRVIKTVSNPRKL
jgi:tyrosinase